MSPSRLVTIGVRSTSPFTFLYPNALTIKIPRVRSQRRKTRQQSDPVVIPSRRPHDLETTFLGALARVAVCSEHLPSIQHGYSKPLFTYHKGRRKPFFHANEQTRHYHQDTLVERSHPQQPLTREECLQMVDFYRDWSSPQASLPLLEAELPVFRYIPSADTHSPGPPAGTNASSEGDSPQVSQEIPEVTRLQRILEEPHCTHAEAFKAYAALPYPGVGHLSPRLRKLLFQRLSAVESRSVSSMIRYLSVVDDMKNAGLVISQWQWNSAMSFAGRCYGTVSAKEIESAMHIWREHGENAGLNARGRSVSLSVLFDLSAKAGKFPLAELILKEMQSLRMPLDRHALVGVIFYQGLRGDGQGVRRAYHEFVTSGQIVDTVVLNCVICSLLRVGEPVAAQQVYERMKRIFAQRTGTEVLPYQDWQQTRSLVAVLRQAAVDFRDQPEKLKALQAQQSLAPNLRTFNIFLDYHVMETGSLNAVVALLDEMRTLGLSMHAKVFVKLFRGFAEHGGVKYTSWTRTRLESVLSALLNMLEQEELEFERPVDAVDELEDKSVHGEEKKWTTYVSAVSPRREAEGQGGDEDDHDDHDDINNASVHFASPPFRGAQKLCLSKWLMIWIVRAFGQCYGARRMRQVWDGLDQRWDPADRKEREIVIGVMGAMERRIWRERQAQEPSRGWT